SRVAGYLPAAVSLGFAPSVLTNFPASRSNSVTVTGTRPRAGRTTPETRMDPGFTFGTTVMLTFSRTFDTVIVMSSESLPAPSEAWKCTFGYDPSPVTAGGVQEN